MPRPSPALPAQVVAGPLSGCTAGTWHHGHGRPPGYVDTKFGRRRGNQHLDRADQAREKGRSGDIGQAQSGSTAPVADYGEYCTRRAGGRGEEGDGKGAKEGGRTWHLQLQAAAIAEEIEMGMDTGDSRDSQEGGRHWRVQLCVCTRRPETSVDSRGDGGIQLYRQDEVG